MTFGNLDTTDCAALDGGAVTQRGTFLELDLASGERLTLAPDVTGCPILRVHSRDTRAVVAVPPALAGRLAAHLAGLAARALEPEPEAAP